MKVRSTSNPPRISHRFSKELTYMDIFEFNGCKKLHKHILCVLDAFVMVIVKILYTAWQFLIILLSKLQFSNKIYQYFVDLT